MSDENENADQKASSLEIIGRVWSSLTSNEDPHDTTETVTYEKVNNNIGSTGENEDETVTNEESNDETGKGSILSNIFSRFNSRDNSENSENVQDDDGEGSRSTTSESTSGDITTENSTENEPESQSAGSLGIISNIVSSLTTASSENTGSEDTQKSNYEQGEILSGDETFDSNIETSEAHTENQRRGSLEIIGDLISNFTSVSNENEEDSVFTNENPDDETDDDTPDAKENESFNRRMRRSSSALYTEPENIDKEDLDYVTLVSS